MTQKQQHANTLHRTISRHFTPKSRLYTPPFHSNHKFNHTNNTKITHHVSSRFITLHHVSSRFITLHHSLKTSMDESRKNITHQSHIIKTLLPSQTTHSNTHSNLLQQKFFIFYFLLFQTTTTER